MEEYIRQTIIPSAVDLLAVVCWGGWLIAAGVLWNERRAGLLGVVQAVFLAGLSLLLFALLLLFPAEYLLEWGKWLQIAEDGIPPVILSGRVNLSSLIVLAAVSVAALHSLLFSPLRFLREDFQQIPEKKTADRRSAGIGSPTLCHLGGFTAGALAVLCDVPVLVAGWWALLNVCWFLSIAGRDDSAGRVATEGREIVRRRFLFRFAADGLILAGLACFAVSSAGSGREAGGASVSPSGRNGAALLIALGVMGRCFAYPFFRSLRDSFRGENRFGEGKGGRRPLSDFVPGCWFDNLFVAALPAVLWVKLFPQGSPPEVNHVLLVAGGLLAVGAAFVAGSQAGRTWWSPLLPMWVGMMLVGTAAPHPHSREGAVFLYLSGVVLWPVIAEAGRLAVSLPGLQEGGPFPHHRSQERGQRILAAGVLISGFGGAAAILSGLTATLERANAAQGASLSVTSCLIALGTLAAAQGRMAFVLVRHLRSSADSAVVADISGEKTVAENHAPEPQLPANQPPGTEQGGSARRTERFRTATLVVLVALLVAGQFLPGVWNRPGVWGQCAAAGHPAEAGTGLDGWVVLLTLIMGGIGGALGWISPAVSPALAPGSLPERMPERTGPLRGSTTRGGILRQVLRLDLFWMRFVVRTLRVMGSYCGLVQQSFSTLLREAGNRAAEGLSAAAEPLEDGSPRFVAFSLILATLLLLLAVGMGGSP